MSRIQQKTFFYKKKIFLGSVTVYAGRIKYLAIHLVVLDGGLDRQLQPKKSLFAYGIATETLGHKIL
ncbi:hypothetical protein M8494_35530 [Serratia ureilytica]